MTKTLIQQIEREIAKEIIEHGNEWALSFFNNFNCYLPGGFYRIAGQQDFWKWGKNFSKIIKKQTFGEFHQTIDNIINEFGFNPKDFVKFQKKPSFTAETQIFYLHKVLPIYIKLREMGYKHYPDFTA